MRNKQIFKGYFDERLLNEIPLKKTEHTKPTFRNSQRVLQSYSVEFVEKDAIFLESFIKDLRRLLLNSFRAKSKLGDKLNLYTFPSDDDKNVFYKELSDNTENELSQIPFANIANASEESIKTWLQSFFKNSELDDQEHDETPCLIIPGKVGSGKTTFIKYLTSNFKTLFNTLNVIPALLPYKVWDIRKDKKHRSQEQLEFDIDYTTIKQLIYTVHKNSNLISTLGDDFKKYFFEERDAFYSNYTVKIINEKPMPQDEIEQRCSYEYKSLIHALRNFNDNLYGTIDNELYLTLLNFLSSKGYKFFIIVDGLDQLSVGGITEGIFRNLFATLAKKTLSYPHHRLHNTIKYHFLYTFRYCTYTEFIKLESQTDEPKKVKILPLAPASITSIIHNAILNLDKLDTEGKYNTSLVKLHIYIDKLISAILVALDIPTVLALSLIFNQNYRELLNFLIELNSYVCSHQKQSTDLDSFINNSIEFLDSNQLKPYEVMEILILRDKTSFSNYYELFIGKNVTFDILTQKNPHRGFVDNIFNYTQLFGGCSTHPLLIGIRLLEHLLHEGYRPEHAITEYMHSIGYQYDISSLLKHFSGSGFIKMRAQSEKTKEGLTNKTEYVFTITGLGTFALDKLTHDVSYVEYLMPHILFPEFITDSIQALYRDKIDEWIKASLYNSYLFYQYIRYIEEIQEANINRTYHRMISSNFKKSLFESLTRTSYIPEPHGEDLYSSVIRNIESTIKTWKNR